MFEDSLVESRVAHLAPAKRWTAIASIALQSSVAALLVTIPLLHPERLALRIDAPPVLVPFLPKPPVKIEPKQISTATSSTSPATPSTAQTEAHPVVFPTSDPAPGDAPPSTSPINFGMNSIPDALRTAGDGHGARVSEAPARPPATRLRISDMSPGMLMTPIRPTYPAIAKAAGVQGTVVVEAVISRTGTIESLHVVSGPPMLREAAMEAIRNARYQPYKLNNEPIEVETMITVNFKISG